MLGFRGIQDINVSDRLGKSLAGAVEGGKVDGPRQMEAGLDTAVAISDVTDVTTIGKKIGW